MSPVSLFERVMRGLMESRGLYGPEDLDGALGDAGRGRSAGKLRAILQDGEAVDELFPIDFADALNLDPEERDELARAVAYGQGRGQGSGARSFASRPSEERPTRRASGG